MQAPAPSKERPLSPHLQVYRWQITMVLSILHRMTGVGLAFGTLLVTGWLFSVTLGEDAYYIFYKLCKSLVGQALIFGFVFALFYHFFNGIRHLFWDAGKGFDMKTATISGWAVVMLSVFATTFFWVFLMVQK